MKAFSLHTSNGSFTIKVDVQLESILSPDSKQKLLPCEYCFELCWKPLNVVSFLCPVCYPKHVNGTLGCDNPDETTNKLASQSMSEFDMVSFTNSLLARPNH